MSLSVQELPSLLVIFSPHGKWGRIIKMMLAVLDTESKGLFKHFTSSLYCKNPQFSSLLCTDTLGDPRQHNEFMSHFLSRFHSFQSWDDCVFQTHRGEDTTTEDYIVLKKMQVQILCIPDIAVSSVILQGQYSELFFF